MERKEGGDVYRGLEGNLREREHFKTLE